LTTIAIPFIKTLTCTSLFIGCLRDISCYCLNLPPAPYKPICSFSQATGKVVEKLRWHGSIIRDCSWHPYLPTLVSSSWDGYLVRWEATEDGRDPSMLRTGKQRMHPEGYTMSFVL